MMLEVTCPACGAITEAVTADLLYELTREHTLAEHRYDIPREHVMAAMGRADE
jgi:hypothetical protein